VALLKTERPVVGVFSTGLLEARAAGIPAWGACVPAVPWVRDFWVRYDIPEWTTEVTTTAGRPDGREPALQVAEIMSRHAAAHSR
jgi:hypothetical protein